MGTVINVHNGEWLRRDSGVGAGSDSYYEYCLKSYILLGDERFQLVRPREGGEGGGGMMGRSKGEKSSDPPVQFPSLHSITSPS